MFTFIIRTSGTVASNNLHDGQVHAGGVVQGVNRTGYSRDPQKIPVADDGREGAVSYCIYVCKV